MSLTWIKPLSASFDLNRKDRNSKSWSTICNCKLLFQAKYWYGQLSFLSSKVIWKHHVHFGYFYFMTTWNKTKINSSLCIFMHYKWHVERWVIVSMKFISSVFGKTNTHIHTHTHTFTWNVTQLKMLVIRPKICFKAQTSPVRVLFLFCLFCFVLGWVFLCVCFYFVFFSNISVFLFLKPCILFVLLPSHSLLVIFFLYFHFHLLLFCVFVYMSFAYLYH